MPTHEQIAEEAFRIWREFGKPEGMDEVTWLLAESALRYPFFNQQFMAELAARRAEQDQ